MQRVHAEWKSGKTIVYAFWFILSESVYHWSKRMQIVMIFENKKVNLVFGRHFKHNHVIIKNQ